MVLRVPFHVPPAQESGDCDHDAQEVVRELDIDFATVGADGDERATDVARDETEKAKVA